MSKASAKVVLRTQRKLIDNRYPIKLRITYNRKSQYYSLPLNIHDSLSASRDEWNSIQSGSTRRNLKEHKRKIVAYEERAEEILKSWHSTGKPFTFDNFKLEFFNKRESRTLADLFDGVIQSLTTENRIGTANAYENAKTSVLGFAGNKSIQLYDVDERFLIRYESWMRSRDRSVSTIGMYLRALKRIINTAIKEGYMDKDRYPFQSYKIPTAKTRKRALSKADVQKLANHKTIRNSAIWKAQQYFILSYLLQGINFTDLAYLKNSNLVAGRLNYIRRKTRLMAKETKTISIKVTPAVEKIVNALRNRDRQPDEYLFPILSKNMDPEAEKKRIKQFTKNTNKWLRKIAGEIEIDPDITTYYARHTYATMLKRSGAPVALIQEALNHHRITTTEAYLDSFENEALDKANEGLL
jgi:integrase